MKLNRDPSRLLLLFCMRSAAPLLSAGKCTLSKSTLMPTMEEVRNQLPVMDGK